MDEYKTIFCPECGKLLKSKVVAYPEDLDGLTPLDYGDELTVKTFVKK